MMIDGIGAVARAKDKAPIAGGFDPNQWPGALASFAAANRTVRHNSLPIAACSACRRICSAKFERRIWLCGGQNGQSGDEYPNGALERLLIRIHADQRVHHFVQDIAAYQASEHVQGLLRGLPEQPAV